MDDLPQQAGEGAARPILQQVVPATSPCSSSSSASGSGSIVGTTSLLQIDFHLRRLHAHPVHLPAGHSLTTDDPSEQGAAPCPHLHQAMGGPSCCLARGEGLVSIRGHTPLATSPVPVFTTNMSLLVFPPFQPHEVVSGPWSISLLCLECPPAPWCSQICRCQPQ